MQIIVSETEGVCSVHGTGEVGDEGLEVGTRAKGADLGRIKGKMRAESNSNEGEVARHINVTVCHASRDRNPRDWIRSGSEQDGNIKLDQSRMGISNTGFMFFVFGSKVSCLGLGIQQGNLKRTWCVRAMPAFSRTRNGHMSEVNPKPRHRATPPISPRVPSATSSCP